VNSQPPNPILSDSIHAFRKEKSTLSFQLVMVREECLEAEEKNEIKPTESSWESDDMKEKDLVMVSMTETNVAVVRGRGCDPENPCNNCGITGCNVSDVIMAPKKREVTSGKQIKMLQLKNDTGKHFYIVHDITIYFYRSNILEDLSRGSPVVLNFTGSTNFLKCTRVNQEVGLTVESYEKEKLKDICKDDPVTWPFVFYMKTRRDNTRLFESAQNKGWFIRTEKPQVSVWMGNPTIRTQERFCFLIYPKHN
uniref:Interleukin-1 beta n=1 Tax=Astyanax mexicanus TaxID=7994 RepID=A0A8B9HEH1_ASTMX